MTIVRRGSIDLRCLNVEEIQCHTQKFWPQVGQIAYRCSHEHQTQMEP